MIGRAIRVIFGFALACLAAGLTVVLFVHTPVELVDLQGERLREVGLLSLATEIGRASCRERVCYVV